MFDDLKALWRKIVLPEIDLDQLGKEALEALAFVAIDLLRQIAMKIPGTFDDDLVEKLAVAADKIDGQKDRT